MSVLDRYIVRAILAAVALVMLVLLVLGALANFSFASGTGAWVRDGDLILNVAGQNSESQFGSMQVFELSPQHRLLALGHAQRATAGSKGKWLLSGYSETRFADDAVTSRPPGPRLLASNVTARFLGLAVEDPKH